MDGTIDIRVVLRVRVDPKAWAASVMEEHDEEVTASEVRKDVKVRLRDIVRDHSEALGLQQVQAEGFYS